uniref:Uncharacterized protein n=1 Tax=Oryza barthii TaxID=65489 RepID=A0A0D3F4T7_9ORYZ
MPLTPLRCLLSTPTHHLYTRTIHLFPIVPVRILEVLVLFLLREAGMKLVWCPEMASKAYIDGVRALAGHDLAGAAADVAELVSAMAGGWNARLVRGAKDLAASMAAGTRVVRSVYLPIGKGVEVLHVGVGKGPSLQNHRDRRSTSRWIRHVDHDTGEEHVFRRQ